MNDKHMTFDSSKALPVYFFKIEKLEKDGKYAVYACKDTGRKSKIAEVDTYESAKEWCKAKNPTWKVLNI